jgi:hypothetical protein
MPAFREGPELPQSVRQRLTRLKSYSLDVLTNHGTGERVDPGSPADAQYSAGKRAVVQRFVSAVWPSPDLCVNSIYNNVSY